MRLYDVHGRLVNKSVSKYFIDWEGKCRSQIQFKVKKFLQPYWFGQIVYEEFPVYGTLLKVDILNATRKIAIEVQGDQHETFIPFFHGSQHGFLKSVKRDLKKYEWLEKNNFKIIEIYESEIKGLSSAFIKDKFDIDL